METLHLVQASTAGTLLTVAPLIADLLMLQARGEKSLIQAALWL